MITHRNKNQIVSMIEHSDYIAVLWSLLIWFTLAWSIWQPGFHTKPEFTHTNQLLTRELPAHQAVAEVIKEEHAAAEEEPRAALVFDPDAVNQELFLKTKPTDDWYLLYFTASDFTIWRDGAIVLYQDDQPVTKLFWSPYYISNTFITASTDISVGLVDSEWNELHTKEHIRFQ